MGCREMCSECQRSYEVEKKRLRETEEFKNASPITQTEFLMAIKLRKMLHLDENDDDIPLPKTQ